MYNEIFSKLTGQIELNQEDVREIIQGINDEVLSDEEISRFLIALMMKGVTLNETAYLANAIHNVCVSLKPVVDGELMDTSGTGGGLSTYNISTATAVIAAAAGIPVAKHGSRSVSSLSGSADVLEALGVNIKMTPVQTEKMIEKIGIAFLYSPLYHPVMKRILPSETTPGIRTIFYTIIGPLINPAFARRHLMGVYQRELLDTVPQVAKMTGYTRAMFVHGLDGLDEISLIGETEIVELKNGEFSRYIIKPEDFGLRRCTLSEIRSGRPEDNALTIKGIFRGAVKDARRDAVLLNAAGALIVGDKASDFPEGLDLAREIIDSGAARKKMTELIDVSNSYLK